MTPADEQRAEFLRDVDQLLEYSRLRATHSLYVALLRIRARLLAAPLAMDVPPGASGTLNRKESGERK